MHAPEPPVVPDHTGEITSFGVLLARIFWTLVGPLLMLLLLYAIVESGRGWLTVWDIIFLAAIPLLVLTRWIEFRSGAATSATGEATSSADFRRYARMAPPLALAAWVLANVLGNHVFR